MTRRARRLLERPARRPILRIIDVHLLVEDLGGLGDTELADNEPGVIGHDSDFAVVPTAKRANEVPVITWNASYDEQQSIV